MKIYKWQVSNKHLHLFDLLYFTQSPGVPQLLHVLSAVSQGKLKNRRLHSLVSSLHDLLLAVHETINVDDFDVEVELRDQVLSHSGSDQLGRIVENDFIVLRFPLLNKARVTFVRYIFVWAEKYSYPCSEVISSISESLKLRKAWKAFLKMTVDSSSNSYKEKSGIYWRISSVALASGLPCAILL